MNILIISAKIKFLKSAIIPKKKSIVFKYKKEKLIIVFKYKKKKLIFFSFLSECSFAATSTSNNEFNRITDLLNTEQKEYNIIYN